MKNEENNNTKNEEDKEKILWEKSFCVYISRNFWKNLRGKILQCRSGQINVKNDDSSVETNKSKFAKAVLHVGVETIRATELLFQPSMIGSSECGLAELIDFIFKMFTSEEQLLLAQNVFLTGGCSLLPGLKERISKELLEMRPFQSPHKIYMADSASLDAWFGARNIARCEILEEFLTTRHDYEENGGEYFREHPTSNYLFNTPAPIVVDPPIE